MKAENLIFIVSQPRSGSTLLQAILSNHSKLDTVSEPWLLLPLLSIYKPSLIQAQYGYRLALDAFFDFQEKTGGRKLFDEEYKSFIIHQYSKIQQTEGNYVLDKTPRYYEIFDTIYSIFPTAKFIILKRHPLSVLKSIMSTWERYDFVELAKYHVQDLFQAPYLLSKWEITFGHLSNVKVLKYEDLVENVQENVEGLMDWLGLDYSPDMLNYAGNDSFKGKYGDPTGVHSASTPLKRRPEDWQTLLSDKKIGEYLNGYGHFLGNDFLSEYGYKDGITYKSNLKFKLFRYYCYRKEFMKHSNYKDKLISLLIRKYLNEKI